MPLLPLACPKVRVAQLGGVVMLSAREREVMLLVAEGLSNKEIARRLEISDGTVKVHLRCIYEKLVIRNRTMLALAASSQIQMMVIDPAP